MAKTTPNIILRTVDEADSDNYVKLQKEVRIVNYKHDDDDIYAQTGTSIINEYSLAYTIVTEDTGDFCGYCAVKDIHAEKPEIVIELLKRYRGKGIGFKALSLLMTEAGERYKISCFTAAVEPDNRISQKLMRKLGGVPNGVRKSIYLDEEDIEGFEADNTGLLDSSILQLAKDFGVQPSTLLSHALLFDIPLDSLSKAIQEQNAGFKNERLSCIDDTNRKISVALRKTAYNKLANKVLTVLKKYGEDDFDKAKAEAIAYLEAKIKETVP
jgi:RimJ/RimL family protein N-acetyltransferase